MKISAIPYLNTSAYFDLPAPVTTASWFIRETGTAPTSTALAFFTEIRTSTRGRVYTAFALGYKGQTLATTRPYISFLLNQ